jgi:hypothetical protein
MKILAIICFSAMIQIKLKTKDQIDCEIKNYATVCNQKKIKSEQMI